MIMYSVLPIDDLTMAFAGSVLHLMPDYLDIPSEFKNTSNQWNQIFWKMFFKGFDTEYLTPKEGVDKKAALRHINAIMRSYEPSHEHKEAAVAFLLSEWFEAAEMLAQS